MVQCKKMRAVLVTALTAIVFAACLGTMTQAQLSNSGEHVRGRAYLFYGLIPAIDWGMDELAQRINRSGVAASTNAHSSWRSVADQAISDYEMREGEIYQLVIDQIEHALIDRALARCSGVKTKAADFLGINRNTLHKKLKEYGLDSE